MSTVFEIPCPGCAEQMTVRTDGDLECAACGRRFHSRLGHLFPLRGDRVVRPSTGAGAQVES